MKNNTSLQALLQLIPAREFQRLVYKWHVDKNVRTLSTQKLVYINVTSQIFHPESLRETGRIFGVAKSTLSDALARRSHGFFDELCEVMMGKILKHHRGKRS